MSSGHLSPSNSSPDKPIVTCMSVRPLTLDAEDGNIWATYFQPELQARLPLKNLDFKNPLQNESHVISTVELEIRKYSVEMFPKFTPGAVQHNLYFVHMFIVSTDDVEVYRSTTRKLIQEWLNVVGNKKNQEWLIVYCAEKTRSNRIFNMGSSTSVYEKLKVDFNLKKDRFVHIGAGSAASPDPKNLEAWSELMGRLKELCLVGISAQIIQYDDDARRLEQQRMIPGWNYCQYFILKEALSFTFELIGRWEEALLQYDELEACFFQTLVEQGAPWFKKFGATEPGDDNPNPFALAAKPYRERIIQNSISIYDFRMYLFSRQCYLLNVLQKPVDIFMRSSLFVSSFSRTLQDYRASLPSHFREAWTFSIVLNIIRHCDELLAICNYSSPMVLAYEGLKGQLFQCARYQLDRLGVAARLLSHSFHYDPTNIPNVEEEETSFDITTPDQANITTSNTTLAQILRTKAEFDEQYESLTQKCFRSFERCKRPATVMYLKADLAFLYFIRQNYARASDFFGEICFLYGELGWNHIDTVLIERYAICQRQLKRSTNLIRCYLHLVRYPQHLELESHAFYLDQLKKYCVESPDPVTTTNCSLFEITNLQLTDRLGKDEPLSCSVHISNQMPTEFLLDSVSVLFQAGDGLEMTLDAATTTLPPGSSTVTVTGQRAQFHGDYFPSQIILKRGQLDFAYQIAPNLQKLCKIKLSDAVNTLVFKASASPTGDNELHFTVQTGGNAFANATLAIMSLSLLKPIYPESGIVPLRFAGSSTTESCKVVGECIALPVLPENCQVLFQLPYENKEASSVDHKLRFELVDTKSSGKRVKYSSTVNVRLGFPFSIRDSISFSASSILFQFTLTGEEQFQTRLDSFAFEDAKGLTPLLPKGSQLLIKDQSISLAALLPANSSDTKSITLRVNYKLITKEIEHYVLGRLSYWLAHHNVPQCFGRLKRSVLRSCRTNANTLDVFYFGSIRLNPIPTDDLRDLFQYVSPAQVEAVMQSIQALNKDLESITQADLDAVSETLDPLYILIQRDIPPCNDQDSHHQIELLLCPLKPGPLRLPNVVFQLLAAQPGIHFESPSDYSDRIVLPREESCRRYFKEVQ
ncbi:hypothetical protein HDV03_001276 [Kappamyces sp. JEL0829]|nr:hypothetical protein HDV03_001276 [Kappamyces sp. JEL0829]